ncbi:MULTISPECIES: hypothetical protein [Helicobacter]|nr:hypothetical protein [Helicobacter sp. UBA3407]
MKKLGLIWRCRCRIHDSLITKALFMVCKNAWENPFFQIPQSMI